MMTTSITAPRVDNLFLLRDIHFLLLGGVPKRHLRSSGIVSPNHRQTRLNDETRDKILDHSSNEYLALAEELEKLEAEALNDDDEPGPDIY
jgi:hypothetical protein